MDNNHDKDRQDVLSHLSLLRQLKQDGATPEAALPHCTAAMETWGPLAEQIGMHNEQNEMLDLAVRLGYPKDYKDLKQLLAESEVMCENVFSTFALPIRSMLDDLNIEYTLKYRMKSIYSIWRKMRVDNKQFDDVYDLFAARIVYKPKSPIDDFGAPNELDDNPAIQAIKQHTIADMDAEKLYCWRIYNVINSLYRIHPDRIKNWIDHPKPSGYQALQMTVMGPDCNWIEIQIRSERMDYDAEYGCANHFLYKQEKSVM